MNKNKEIEFVRELMKDFNDDEIQEAEDRLIAVLSLLLEHHNELVDLGE